MPKFIKITAKNIKGGAFINIDLIKSLYTRHNGETVIDMVGDNEDNYFVVEETPREILKAIQATNDPQISKPKE